MPALLTRLACLVVIAAVVAAWFPHGKTGAGSATLSAQSAIGVGWSDARGTVSTDTSGGTLFATVQPTSIAGTPTATQIKTCKNADGTTAAACTSLTPSSGSNSKIRFGCTQSTCLTSATNYKIWFVQNTSGGDSNVVNAAFTTNGKITIVGQDDNTTCTAGNHWSDNPNVTQWNAVRTNVLAFMQANYSAGIAQDQTYIVKFGYNCADSTVLSGGGATTVTFPSTISYNTQLRPAVQSVLNQNSIQSAVFGSLPASDPTGTSNLYQSAVPQECSIGFDTTPGDCTGVLVLAFSGYSSATVWNTVVDGTTSNGNPQLWEAMHHELTEVLSRLSGINIGAPISPYLLDAESYSGTGVHSVLMTGSRYPSQNNGASSVYGGTHGFNQGGGNCNATGTGDCGDLDGTVSSAFNAFTSGSIIANPPLQGDFILITVQGYGLSEKALTCAEDGGTACTSPF